MTLIVAVLLIVIAGLLLGLWLTVASVNYRLGLIREHFCQIETCLVQIAQTLKAPHDLSRLSEIEIPVLVAALNDLTQALAEQWHFNLNYRKN